jgi:transcriptional regulator with XRE-family HTH domain
MTELYENADQHLYGLLQSFAEKRKWHLKYAKFNWRVHQSLLTHSLNVASISLSLLEFLENNRVIEQKDSNNIHLQLLLTGFLHDCGKESDIYQNAVRQSIDKSGPEPLDFGHQHEKVTRPVTEALKEHVNEQLNITDDILDEVIWSITQLGKRENAAAISQSFSRSPSMTALLCAEIVHFSDVLASKQTVDEGVNITLDGPVISKLSLCHSKIAHVRGVLTHFLHVALEEQFENQGFKPLLWFPDGTIYVGLKENCKPKVEKDMIKMVTCEKMKNILSQSHAREMARAAFGGLPQRVICAPEFLLTSNETIRLFWKFILAQKFSDPSNKADKDLTEPEKKLLMALSEQLRNTDEISKRMFLSRFIADFNLFIVLYAIRKELIDSTPNNNKKMVMTDATQRINSILVDCLGLQGGSIDKWPEIALQTKTEKRMSVVLSFQESPYYHSPHIWRNKLEEALIKSTLELRDIWKTVVPDKFEKISKLLTNDIAVPIDSATILEDAKELEDVIARGKTNHGTIVCQKCGGVASIEAQAKLFGGSEIYHDNLIAGLRVGGGNKLNVCELCEFEEKLRLMLTGGNTGYTNSFYILPQLSLSRKQQIQWQTTINKIEHNRGNIPSLFRLNQWAEAFLNDQNLFISDSMDVPYLSQTNLLRVINDIAVKENLENDLSPMIDPPLDARNGAEVLTLLNENKAKLTDHFQQEVDKSLNQVELVYIAPNFMLLLTEGTVAQKDEPVVSTEIKWTYLRCLLARIFHATVHSEVFRDPHRTSLGHTMVLANLNLRPLSKKLNTKNGWIDIPDVEQAIKKLSALILIEKELSANAGYGKSTLLRLLHEEPGRVLHRAMTKNNKVNSRKLIKYLDIWYKQ